MKAKLSRTILTLMAFAIVGLVYPSIAEASETKNDADVAQIIKADGTTTGYTTINAASNTLKPGDTLQLLQDVSGTASGAYFGVIGIGVSNVTIDLNGHNITNTATTQNNSAIDFFLNYDKKNVNGTVNIINTSEKKTSVLHAPTPITMYCGNMNPSIKIEGNIVCENSSGNNISTGGAKIVYTDTALSVMNGAAFSGMVDGTAYLFSSASAAINASDDHTAVLLKDYNGKDPLSLSSGTGIIDLNGKSYSTSVSPAISVLGSNVSLTVKNGTVESTVTDGSDSIGLGVLTNSALNQPYDNVNVTLDNCEVNLASGGLGVYVNGSNSNAEIQIVNNSNIYVPSDGIGIYFPPKTGALTVNNSSVTGGTGIAVKGGNVYIQGNSTITGSGQEVDPSNQQSGVSNTGDAIYVDGSYDRAIQVKVENGNIRSTNAEPLQLASASTSASQDITVTGGRYSKSIPVKYLSEGLKYEIQSEQDGTKVFTYAQNLNSASENAQPGDVISAVTEEATTIVHATISYENGTDEITFKLPADTKYSLPAAPSRNGYNFVGWRIGDNTYEPGTEITITDGMVITAVWREIVPEPTPNYNYQVTVQESENGTVTIAKEDQWANEGEKISVTVKPDEGYMVENLIITDKNGKEISFIDNEDGTYTFTMPEGKVHIEATFVVDPNYEEPGEEPEPSTDVSGIFSDITPDAWYKDVVQYVYDNGLMTGTSDTTFEPNTSTTRGMVGSILHRLEGSPVVTNSDFSDVKSDDWYGQAVAWAASEGLVGGYGDGTFQPNKAITREEMASIFYRYSQYKSYDVNERADLSGYKDAPSDWAMEVMQWANAEGIINGMTENTLNSQGNATRAQVAAMLYRFIENVSA